MVTAIIEFEGAWLSDVINPTVNVHACFPDSTAKLALDGDVRFYAGGRSRVITTNKRVSEFPLVMSDLTADEVQQMQDWRGKTLLLRDEIGRRVFGTYLSLDVTDRYTSRFGWRSMVSLTFTELTYSEGV